MAIFSRCADTVGDGSGDIAAIGNYAGAAEEFILSVPAPFSGYEVHRLIISIEDAGGMQAQEYGNIGAALTNGITVQMKRGSSVQIDLTTGLPVKTNAQWGVYCYDVEVKGWGSGNDLLVCRWTFSKSGDPVYLDRSEGDQMIVTLNDDFTALISHTFLFQGREIA